MPNLVPPVTTAAHARAYRKRIQQALAQSGVTSNFTPMMTLYLTETTDPADVVQAVSEGDALAVKLYPAGATTNSDSGVRDIEKVMLSTLRLLKVQRLSSRVEAASQALSRHTI